MEMSVFTATSESHRLPPACETRLISFFIGRFIAEVLLFLCVESELTR